MEAAEFMSQNGHQNNVASGSDLPTALDNRIGLLGPEKDAEGPDDSSSVSDVSEIGEQASEAEKATMRTISDKLPWSAFLVAFVELCERFTYNGLTGPFQNYMQRSYHDPSGLPGAIGLTQTGATSLSNFFQFWCYLTPIGITIPF